MCLHRYGPHIKSFASIFSLLALLLNTHDLHDLNLSASNVNVTSVNVRKSTILSNTYERTTLHSNHNGLFIVSIALLNTATQQSFYLPSRGA